MAEIKFCENNFSHGTEDLANKLVEEIGEDHVEIEPCLGFCGDCAIQPFAVVNDVLIKADSSDELYDKIKAEL